MAHRLSKSLLYRPASLEPALYGAAPKSENLSPFSDAPSLSVMRERVVVCPVPCLLSSVGPLAICWRVVAICVDTVYRQAFWPISHALIKCLKGLSPFFAHRYSSAAIVGVPLIGEALTSSYHSGPYSVGWRSAKPVGCRSDYVKPVSPASAGGSIKKPERGAVNNNSVPAVAFAYPVDTRTLSCGRMNSNKVCESLASNIFGATFKLYNRMSHVSSSLIDLVRGWGVGALHSRHYMPLLLAGER